MDERISVLVPMRPNRGRTQLVGFGDRGIARLRAGVSIAEANKDAIRCISIAPSKFAPNPGMPPNILQIARLAPTFETLRQSQLGTVGDTLWVLLGAVVVLLGLACANVSNLLLVRTEARQKEIAVRRALGAGWARTARDIVVETVLLSLAGSACAIAFGWIAIAALRRAGIANLPRIENIAMDARSVGVTILVAVAVGVGVGLLTVWAALRRTSWEGMRPSSRKQQGLLALQMALAMVLLVASGLVLRSYVALQRVEPGFRGVERVQAVRVSVPPAQGEKLLRMHRAISEGFAKIPGVEAVAVTTSIPMEGGSANPHQAEGHPPNAGASAKIREQKRVSPGYLRSIGTRLVAGREFTWEDCEAMRPVVMVSENMAGELWGGSQAALGKRIRENSVGDWREIVGVVEDVRNNGPMKEAPTMVYAPLAQLDQQGKDMSVPRNVDYVIRSPRAGSAALVEDLRQSLLRVEASVPLAKLRTLEEVYRRSMARTALALALMGAAGVMALLLGVVGIYGVVAYAVARRRKDIGVRIALGASGSSVAALFLRDGLKTALAGSAVGLLAAMGLMRFISAVLFGVGTTDPLTYASVALILLGAAALASWWPARRAAAVNPIEALRVD
jgi:predicted permease